MLQLVLGLVAIGLVLFLWQAFPAFKWVLAAIIGIPVLLIATIIYKDLHRQEERHQEQAQQIKEYEQEQAELAKKAKKTDGKAQISYENAKAVFEALIQQVDQKEKSGHPNRVT